MSFDVRRRLYNQLPQVYATDGLVFELNATKGLSEDGWIEQISGKKFTWTEGSEKVFDNAGVHLGSSIGANGSFMSCENSTFDWIAASECSMDICIVKQSYIANSVIFNLGMYKGFATEYMNSHFVHCGTPSAGCYMLRGSSGSANASNIYTNFSESKLYIDSRMNSHDGRYYPRLSNCTTGSVAMLGANPDGSKPSGDIIIRAIRIYNRPLTAIEILYNFNTDKALFT